MTTIELEEGIASLRQYLAIHVELRQRHRMKDPEWVYWGMEDFVLKEGQMFLELSPHQPSDDRRRNRYRPRIPRHCFDNSFKAAVASRGKLGYVEGYAYNGFIPVLHAWNIDEHGLVVDTTWCGSGINDFRPGPGSAYMGVIFPIEYVRSHRTNDNTSMIDAWQHDWPVLRQKWLG